MKKYTFTYYDAIFPMNAEHQIILDDTKTTWESDTLDDKNTIAAYFATLKRAYEASGKFIGLNVKRDDIIALGVRIDNNDSPYLDGEYRKILEIKENRVEINN